VDFLVEREGVVLPIEVKSGKHCKRHRALNRVVSDPEYDISEAFVFNDDRIAREGKIRYVPIYMAMFPQKDALSKAFTYDIGSPLKIV